MKVGIDLGTTYSTVAIYDKNTNKPIVLNNAFGKEVTPSVICFLDDGDILVGEDAKDMQLNGAGINASAFKMSMGDRSILISFKGKNYTSEDLSSIVLKHLIQDAEKTLGQKIEQIVVTVPAYFNDFQRTATIRAGESCGVKVSKIINEPTAAAISYGYRNSSNKTIMIYDLGGGTFDVTIARIYNGSIEVIGTDGNHILGGKDWDKTITKYICDQFIADFNVDIREDIKTKNTLIVAAEGYKKTLSIAESVLIPVNYDGYSAKYTLTRCKFESITEHLLKTTGDICCKLISDLNMSWIDIDEVLLVGGSTRMPAVTVFMRNLTGRNVIAHQDRDLAVAKGAAIMAELDYSNTTSLREIHVSDVTAHSLGILSISNEGNKYINEIMIKRNSRIPCTACRQLNIKKGNITNKIEIYTLQGESIIPLDCNILAKVVVSGFHNTGDGITINIEYNYDENGVVNIMAFQDGKSLNVVSEPVPENVIWMGGDPHNRPRDEMILKNIAICVDLSRSMSGDPIESAKRSICDFVDQLKNESTKFTLIGFGDKIKIIQDLTNDANTIIKSTNSLKVKMVGRGTDASPLDVARNIINSEPGVGIIVILTDGIWGKRNKAIQQQMKCKLDNISIIAIGFGRADTSFLKQIATVDDGALFTTIDRLSDTFETIATAISSGEIQTHQ